MIEIRVPEVGESITSGILAVWLKKDGEYVAEGDELFELETDKATMAVPSQNAGVLHISVPEGEEVEVGSVVAKVDEEASPDSGGDSNAAAAGKKAKATESAKNTDQGTEQPESPRKPNLEDLGPAVRKLVADNNLDPAEITGTGPRGRILKEDVLSYLSTQQAGSARRGTEKVEPRGAASSTTSGALESPLEKPNPGSRNQRRVAMTTIRKRIAQRLVESKQSAAHLTTFNEVDMSAVMEMRSHHKESFEKRYGVRLGFMSFFIKAAVSALQAFPGVNAFIDGEDIIYHDYADIGVAMSTERGLITPVLRNCEDLSFAEIEQQIIEYGQKAKNKRILPDELMGGTFTVSNGGVFGSMLSTPIPNPPQTAVLGMHTIQERPVVRDGQIVARPMMYLALTYDHRMVDGKEAISFLVHMKNQLEDPARMLLGL